MYGYTISIRILTPSFLAYFIFDDTLGEGIKRTTIREVGENLRIGKKRLEIGRRWNGHRWSQSYARSTTFPERRPWAWGTSGGSKPTEFPNPPPNDPFERGGGKKTDDGPTPPPNDPFERGGGKTADDGPSESVNAETESPTLSVSRIVIILHLQ